ncbi:uncharacterized protein LOC133304063 [Gastrolobium bilobum]|uniref:uncharacterized protein LOC133304063 n=1 Tax=Gastrolobium bilobum TaxID=150636 RepID=UPI002AB0F03C|nr:uncharacterized protein LOC133304063 [Gastrolobium bilobum]
MEEDSKQHVRHCVKCHEHTNLHHAPLEELSSLISPWPFYQWGMDILGPFLIAIGGVKWLIVAIDYFTKWIEVEALATILASKIRRFFYGKIICRFGVPNTIVTNNGTQFVDKKFNQVLQDLHIKHRYTSVEHPQTNGLVEAANRVLKLGLERRLEATKGDCPEQLDYVLWGNINTPHSTTGGTPFHMVYGSEIMILVEIGEPSWRKMYATEESNSQALLHNLDTINEIREIFHITEVALKQRITSRYNSKVIKCSFNVGELIQRRTDFGNKNARQGKLAANWEGPYRVQSKTEKGAYIIETLSGLTIPHTWNADKLKIFYC